LKAGRDNYIPVARWAGRGDWKKSGSAGWGVKGGRNVNRLAKQKEKGKRELQLHRVEKPVS